MSNEIVYISKKNQSAHSRVLENSVVDDCKKNYEPQIIIQDEYYLLLTNRENDCLNELLFGKTAKMIAKKLKISPRTVESHLQKLKKKLRVRTKYELIAKVFARRRI